MASVKLNLTVTEKNYSVENNTSDINWSLSVTSVAAFNGNNWQCPWEVRYNNSSGGLVASGEKGFKADTTTQLASGTITGYKHNDNGSASITLYAHYYTDDEDWMVVPKEASTTTTIKLTDIPRATTAPTITAYVEDTVSLLLEPKSTSFSHNVKLEIGSFTRYINASGLLSTSSTTKIAAGTAMPINFTLPSSLYNQFSGKEIKGRLTVTTYRPGTLISGSYSTVGTSTSVFTVQCNPSKCAPSCNVFSIYDINDTSVNATGSKDNLIKYISTAEVTLMNPKATLGTNDPATMTSITVNGVAATNNVATFPNTTTDTFNISMTNSRGFTTTVTVSNVGSFINYSYMTFNGTVARVSPTSGQVKLTYNGNYYGYAFNTSTNVKNTIKLYFKYREKYSSEWITPSDNEITGYKTSVGSTYRYSGEYVFPVTFDYTKQYEIVIYYNDLVYSSEAPPLDLIRGLPVYWWDKDSFNIIGDLTVNDQKILPNEASLCKITFGNQTVPNHFDDMNSNTEYYDGLEKVTSISSGSGKSFSYGDYSADTTIGRLVITNTTFCEVSGTASGFGDFEIKYRLTEKWDNANYSELIQSDYSIGSSFRLYGGSIGREDTQWQLPLPTKLYKLDPTKTYYIYLTIGLKDGIMSRTASFYGAEITARKIL